MRLTALAWPLLGILALLAARRWLDVVEVRGRSMAPALLPGDRLLVVRAPPRPGDVVLVLDPRDQSRELIKRVAAVGDDGVVLRGDNPKESTDARAFGAVALQAVEWRAALRYWPLSRIDWIPRSSRSCIRGTQCRDRSLEILLVFHPASRYHGSRCTSGPSSPP